ncbi:peptidoglycan binding domain-containing protein [Clostridium sp. FAM 1755]|uniref:L,D-transpeptidase family protein n=1 Tax=Clostridium TaxID=1485 RepID=UPI0006AB9978|nr:MULTISPECIES: peptidoglycan binding domain-containing protein [Clostridium]KOR26691.1 erfK/YbiS/YcfS/YnhG family protein [Clostridium sp. L74]NFV11581.1 peptidoglycan-binding protein [Clostridium sporogenes]
MNKGRTRSKNHIRPRVIGLLSILIIYLCMVLYFKNHFYFRTTINGIKASGKTVEEINKEMESEVKNYALQLEGRDGSKEKISAKDFNLKYNTNNEIQKLKDAENPFNIFKAIFLKKDLKMPRTISYDEEALKQHINKMVFFNENKITNPKNASLNFTGKEYAITAEVMGNKVNKDNLIKEIKNAIVTNKEVINLEQSNCYENPKYTAKSKEVIEAKNTMDKYLQAVITYDIRGNKEVVNASKINNWLKTDEKFKPYVDKEKVRAYIDNLAYTYNTVGITRDFVTASGAHVKVSGGSYGWAINRSKETENLIQAITESKTINKKPSYAQTTPYTGSDDIGNTYVEIDLTKQHLWFYKNGSIIADGDIVTGNVSLNYSTPEGVYKLEYKEKNSVLRGENYAAPVDFWMPFNGGIGMHDASWRKEFGGTIYQNGGSHGCINCPPALAQIIFETIEPGTPIICHK